MMPETTPTRLILLMAPSFQGGHSEVGKDVADFLGIRFPLTMSGLAEAARERLFNPEELWPWWAKMQAERAAQRALEEGDMEDCQ